MKKSNQINQKSKFILISILLILMGFLFFSGKEKEVSQEEVSMERFWQNTVNFFTDLIGDHDLTEVSFNFKFENEPIDLWIAFNAQNQDLSKKEYLIFHPQIHQLGWSKISSGEMTLYQKEVNYNSIEDFLKNPSGTIYADLELVMKHGRETFQPIELNMNLDEIDYILTTYIPVKENNDGSYFFKNVLYTKDAKINEAGRISWGIYAPNASEEKAYFRDEIQVTYLHQE